MGCGIDRRSPSTIRIGCRLRRRRRSWRCVATRGGGHARCQLRWGGRRRRSGGCLCGMTARVPANSRVRQRIGMSTPRWVSWYTWTSRSWVASGRSANACSTAEHAARAQAGATPTSRLTTTHATPPSSCDHAEQGTPIKRILTDNGTGYRSHAFRRLLAQHGIRHIRTKPYTPRTNGKAEAFIRILQREWAYAYIYPTSSHRAKALPGWTRWYNNHRPHGGIDGHPPTSRVSHAARSYT